MLKWWQQRQLLKHMLSEEVWCPKCGSGFLSWSTASSISYSRMLRGAERKIRHYKIFHCQECRYTAEEGDFYSSSSKK